MPKYGGNSDIEIQLRAAKERNQILSVRIQQMKDQHANENARQQEIITQLRHAESSARTLCTIILSKDRSEMQLGTNYNWNSLDTEELIKKAINSYREYCSGRTKSLQQMKDYAMEKARKLEEMEDQIGELKEEHKKELRNADNEAAKAKRAMSEAVQKLGTSVIKPVIDSVRETTGSLNNIDTVVEDEISEASESIQGTLKVKEKALTEVAMKKEPEYALSKSAKAQVEKLAKETREKADEATASLMEKLDDLQWTIIEVIGKTGYSEQQVIFDEIRRKTEYKDGTIYTKIKSLNDMNILTQVKGTYAGVSRATFFKLNAMGIKLYSIRYKKTPEPAEMDIINAEHTSLKHGYSIKACYLLFKTSGQIKNLSMYTRKQFSMDSGNGTKYIPDIVGEYENRPIYFEYETGTMEDASEIWKKLDKMIFHTREYNFISPGQQGTVKIQKAIYEWIQKNKNESFMKSLTIRFTTFDHLKKAISAEQPFDSWWTYAGPAVKFDGPTVYNKTAKQND